METEYEATFYPVDKDDIRNRLASAGGVRLYPERLMKRITFNLPGDITSGQIWARVRDEGDKVTMSVKEMRGTGMGGQKEAMAIIDSFESGTALLKALGCMQKAYQETRRELWKLDSTEVTIDEWPFLDPLVEVEGRDESEVRAVSEKLGFKWSDAKFCPAGEIYVEKYGVTPDRINNHTPRLVFGDPNPFT